jgi:hypothetical protein
MNKAKIERRIARGGARWHAPRMKSIVKKRAMQNIRKPKQS